MRRELTEDEKYMKEALRQARKAYKLEEAPIGCVIVYEGKIIARGYNRRNKDKCTLSHAEILAIKKAAKVVGDWRLEGCTMYVTLEPCQMCAGAIVQARIDRVVIGSRNAKAGCAGSVINLLQMEQFNHQTELTDGVLQEECSALMSGFFRELRERQKSEKKKNKECTVLIGVYVKPWTKENGSWEPFLKEILRRDYGLSDIAVERDEWGKPFLRKEENLFFNLSHSGAYIVIAVSDRPIGVDIEGMRRIRDGMYRKVVQQEEERLIGADRERDFLQLWTLKESFVKAEGKGLRIPMKDYYFVKDEQGFSVHYRGQKAPWRFFSEDTFADGYVISVCGLEKEIRWIAETEKENAV